MEKSSSLVPQQEKKRVNLRREEKFSRSGEGNLVYKKY